MSRTSTWLLVILCALIAARSFAAPTPQASLNNCQNTVRAETARFIKNKVAAVGVCLQQISTDLIKHNTSAAGAAATCVAQFRKISDSRNLGKSVGERLSAKILSKCAPGNPSVTHTLNDVTGLGPNLPQQIDASDIAAWCSSFGGNGSIVSVQDWRTCIETSAECAVDASIAAQYPRALEWLNLVRPAMLLVTPPANDPTKVSDAVAGLDAVDAAIDGPDNDDVPSIACGASCSAGETTCAGSCRDLQTDRLNCGSCGHACANGYICSAANCVLSCPVGLTDCTSTCSNTNYDPNNCSSCGLVCPTNHVASPACAGGLCSGTCSAGFANCDSTFALNGCNVNTQSDTNNCGGCGATCSNNHLQTVSCGGGNCNGFCAFGFSDCDGNLRSDGCEIDTQSDVNNCGGCGFVCTNINISSPSCGSGLCNGACTAGFADCNGNKRTDGCEVDTHTDVNNCGGCGVSCSSNNILRNCASGICNGSCTMGFEDCDNNKLSNGCEVNTQTDVNNCGGCGAICSPNNITRNCASGVCNGSCLSGFADCDGNRLSDGCEVNTNSDHNNCGSCGHACTLAQTCMSGTCM